MSEFIATILGIVQEQSFTASLLPTFFFFVTAAALSIWIMQCSCCGKKKCKKMDKAKKTQKESKKKYKKNKGHAACKVGSKGSSISPGKPHKLKLDKSLAIPVTLTGKSKNERNAQVSNEKVLQKEDPPAFTYYVDAQKEQQPVDQMAAKVTKNEDMTQQDIMMSDPIEMSECLMSEAPPPDAEMGQSGGKGSSLAIISDLDRFKKQNVVASI